MFQIPVQNLDKIRKARKKVKGILVDIGLDSCRELLQAINSYDPGEKYFYNTSWGDMSLWDSSGRKMKYRTKPYCCSLCNFSTKLPSSFKNHLHRYHEDEMDQELMVACPSCAFASQSKTVVKHMRMFHTSVRKIQHYAVNSLGGVSQSRKDTVKFSCLKCSFTDPLYYSMKRHVLMTHFENLISTYFGERSDNTSLLNGNEALSANELKSPPSHKFYCKQCNAFANTQDALVYHILTSEKHRDLEYELRSVISEFNKSHFKKMAHLKSSSITPRTQINHPGLIPTSTAAVSMSSQVVNMFSMPQNGQNLAIAKQSQGALHSNASTVPVTSSASGSIMQTSGSVGVPPHMGFVPNSLPTSQNITLQPSLPQSVFVSHRFPITQPVGPGVLPLNQAGAGILPPTQPLQPGIFPHPQAVRPGPLSFNQPVQAGVLPVNPVLPAGGFSLNQPVGPGALGMNQPVAPGVFSVNQSVRPGFFPANQPGLAQNTAFMTAAPMLRQLIPTGKQINGMPMYTLAPVPVTLPVAPGGVANVTTPQVPIQLTQTNTVAQISHSPASAPSPVVMTSKNMLDQTSRRGLPTNTPGKQAKQWKTCPVCNELFPSNVYQVHMEVAHKQQGVLRAGEQNPQKKDRVEAEKLAARAPFLRWIREKTVRCLSCKCFLREDEIIKHLMMHGIICLFCSWTCHDLTSLVMHNKSLHGEKKKLHVDYIKRGFELSNDNNGNILFPHFDFHTALPKEEIGEKEINLAVLAVANSRTFVPIYIKVQHQITETINKCIKQALKCPFCLCNFFGSEVYETHLKDRHHIMPTVHTILKTPAFKCIHCCGVYTGNMTLTAIAVHLLRCRSAPKDSSSGVLAPLDESTENGQPVNGEVHDSALPSNKRKSSDSSSGVPLAGDQKDKVQEALSNYTNFKMSGKELIPVYSKRKKTETVAKPTGFPSGDEIHSILALDPKQYEKGSHENRKHFLSDYFHKRPYPAKREVELLSSLLWAKKIDVTSFFGKKQNTCLRAIETCKPYVLLGFKMSELKNVKHSLSIQME